MQAIGTAGVQRLHGRKHLGIPSYKHSTGPKNCCHYERPLFVGLPCCIMCKNLQEAIEDRMANQMELKVSAFHCKTCNTISEGRRPRCSGHDVKQVQVDTSDHRPFAVNPQACVTSLPELSL